MLWSLLHSILPLAVPILGILSVVIFIAAPEGPTKPGTSTKPEGRDPHDDRGQ